LRPELQDDGTLELQTYLPTAWKITGSVYLTEEALPCVTLCLYRKDAFTEADDRKTDSDAIEEDSLDARLITALEVMAREGDRIGTHGFVLLWKDHGGFGLTDYNISVCGIAPMQLYKMSRVRGNISAADGKLVAKLDEYITDHDPSGHSEALMKVATSANELLEEIANPMLEGFHYWQSDEVSLRWRAEPLMCEFWGTLGDYARHYVMHPAVRTHRRSTLMNGFGNWRDPAIGLPLMKSFRQPSIFFDGSVRCADAFQLGRLLGLDRILRANIKDDDRPALRCAFEWNRIELATAIDEVRMLANAALNVKGPELSFKFYDDPCVIDEDDHQLFVDWLLKEFFQSTTTHLPFFLAGYEGSFLFERREQGQWITDPPNDIIAQLEPHLRNAFLVAYSPYERLHNEDGLWGDLGYHHKTLLETFEIKENFEYEDVKSIDGLTLVEGWQAVLDAANRLVDPVFHKHAPIALAKLDWAWMKQGIAEMRMRGVSNPGVILLPNGQWVTGSTTPDMPDLQMNVEDPDTEVIFLDQSHGIGFMRIVGWSALEDGNAFLKLEGKAES
jgi:hypothetical protein